MQRVLYNSTKSRETAPLTWILGFRSRMCMLGRDEVVQWLRISPKSPGLNPASLEPTTDC
jgi:hypothetical protein